MKSWKIIIVFVNILFVISLCCCVPEEIILHGDISGFVTDAETSQPLYEAAVELNPSSDSTSTGIEGEYLLKNISPQKYEIKASKPTYYTVAKDIEVKPGVTTEIDFDLIKGPSLSISDSFLDFGLDLSIKSFTISNVGAGTLRYSFLTSHDRISVYPTTGVVTTETDTIRVTIDRTGLSEITYKETINIFSIIGKDILYDEMDVFVNGVVDQDGNPYSVVTIGTQIWMAENLNTGIMINHGLGVEQINNGVVEKYCYDDIEYNCGIYGGLYAWQEMMDYYPSDTGTIGTTQGICPDGWHIPTEEEWNTLVDYLDGVLFAGEKLKDTTTLWISPNVATNESGFMALPGGDIDFNQSFDNYNSKGVQASFWTAKLRAGPPDFILYYRLINDLAMIVQDHNLFDSRGFSVRCIKDP